MNVRYVRYVWDQIKTGGDAFLQIPRGAGKAGKSGKLERCILAPPIEVEKTWLTGIFQVWPFGKKSQKTVHGCFKVLGSFFHPTINKNVLVVPYLLFSLNTTTYPGNYSIYINLHTPTRNISPISRC